jgi:tRNA (guanosine-2'-O-)-methyltransferase
VPSLSSTDLKRLHRTWRQRTEGALAIALDGVQGPFNVGAIIRTAAAYRAEHFWLNATATGPENSKVGKTALGTDRYLQVERLNSVVEIAAAAHALDFQVIGIELASEARPLHEIELPPRTCFVLGNEDHGMSKASMAACDSLAFLPQLGKVGSLNVATAASIAMYEWARQQWSADGSV